MSGLKPGSVLRGKWTLEGELGAGGMATVYAGTHRNGMRGAIKVLHPRYAKEEQIRSRMLREGYLANKIKHRGIVRVLDDDVTEEGWVFLVMELLEGETLKDRWVHAGGKLPVEEALDIAEEVLDVLVAAHAEGVIHRDIKPDNIFILHDGSIKLLDFGIARVKETSSEMTQTGAMLGTPAFMSPEQALAHWDKVDGRSDIFAVGATLWTMLTGELTHKATTVPELLVAAATKQVKPIHSMRSDLPVPIAALIDRALAFDKEERWPSAVAMLEALRDARKSPGSTVRMDLGPDPAGLLKKMHGPKTVEAGPMILAPTVDARMSAPSSPTEQPRSVRTIEMPAVSERDPAHAVALPSIAFDATPVRLQQAIPFEPTLAVASSSQSVPFQLPPSRSASRAPVIVGLLGTVSVIAAIALFLWKPWAAQVTTAPDLPSDRAGENEVAPVPTSTTDIPRMPMSAAPTVTPTVTSTATPSVAASSSAAPPMGTVKPSQRPSQPVHQKPGPNDWMNKPSQPPR